MIGRRDVEYLAPEECGARAIGEPSDQRMPKEDDMQRR